MIIKKVAYNDGKNEGYFIETRKGYVQVIIKEGEAVELSKIKKISEIKINEVNLKVQEIDKHESYIR